MERAWTDWPWCGWGFDRYPLRLYGQGGAAAQEDGWMVLVWVKGWLLVSNILGYVLEQQHEAHLRWEFGLDQMCRYHLEIGWSG